MPDIFIAPFKKEEELIPKISEETPQIQKEERNEKTDLKNFDLFTSYSENPTGISFQNQDPGEKVLLFIRRDFITNLNWIILGIILLIGPFVPLYLINWNASFSSFFPFKYVIFSLLFYYLLVFTYVFVNFFTWFFNISLITNMRIIDIEFSNLVYRSVSATKLNLVQDVSYTQNGVIRSIFDYGDVLVQTAGTIDNFSFESAPSPENVVHVIGDLIGKGKNAV